MRNIKLVLEYDGRNYYGWQIQPNLVTIQGTVEEALNQLTQTQLRIVGAGRTDSGVHAEGQVANFHTDSPLPLIAFQKALNAILPRDIVICSATEVPADFHARFSAVSRRYRYTILNRAYRSTLLRKMSYFYPAVMDVTLMDAICQSLVGKQDFSSFQKQGSTRLDPVCEIYEAHCFKIDDCVYIEIEADSFLRGMVRAIVGTLLKCMKTAEGNTGAADAQLHRILEAKDRAVAGQSVPAHGLSLVRVKYDE